MASRNTGGNLKIIGDSDGGGRFMVGSQQQQQQQQGQKQQQQRQEAEISDDEEVSATDDMEITTFSGIEAVKVCHFCKTELENLGKNYLAKVSKEPTEGTPTKVTITGDKKFADNIKENVDKMKDELKKLTEEVLKFDVTLIDGVKQLRRQYDENSGVLIHISPMHFKVYVIGNGNDKMRQALHQVKVALGLITPSKRTGRQTESSASPQSPNKLYPQLPQDGRIEEDMDTSEYGCHADRGGGARGGANGQDPEGTDVDRPFRRPKRNDRERSPYNKYNDKARLGSSNDNDDFDFTFPFESGFVLKVYKESITKVKVDSIVNAANDNLMHGGGVARVISKAAGYKLDQESNDHVQKKGLLGVGENCLTTAGCLPYRSVIHAVGPQWHDSDYRDNKEKCLCDLHLTVYNVLRRAQKENYKKVAMSAISAGIYAVPKELCADMYVQAVVDFINEGRNTPKELHIVDIDTSILKLVQESCEKWKRDPASTKPAIAWKQYFQTHPSAAYVGQGHGYGQGQGHGYGRGRRFQRQFSEPAGDAVGMSGVTDTLKGLSVKKEGMVSLKWGGKDAVYDVNGSLKVHIYTGKIDKVQDVDAVVCSIDTYFGTNGYIVKAFRDAFAKNYRDNFEKLKRKEKSRATVNYVYTCETGSVTVPYIMHLAMNPLATGSTYELQEYKKGITNILNKAERRGFGKVAVPLLGTGNVQNRPEILQSCGRCVLEAIRDFCCDSKSKSLIEVHLVNNKEEITQSMRSLFEAVENRSRGSEKPKIPRASSFDVLENVRDDHTKTRVLHNGSMSSSGRDKSDPNIFDNNARSRVGDDRDESTPNFTDTETPGAVGWIQETDDRKPDTEDKKKKAKGNLRIIVDD